MGYYAAKLAGERLRRCYEVAPPRVRRYLQAERDHALERLARVGGVVLELGCGYGRIALDLDRPDRLVVGIDTAADSLALGRLLLTRDLRGENRHGRPGCAFAAMDAVRLALGDGTCDAVLCLQNGACAFGVDQGVLIREAVRVCRPGGMLLFSSYAAAFWPHRLRWFELQAAEGLVGEIDREQTGDGVIACKDGFRVGFLSPAAFAALFRAAGLTPAVVEVDGSVTFCEARVP